MIATLIILAIAAALFVHGKIRADIVAIGALLAFMLSGVLTPQEALSGFSSTIVMMLVCVFIVGGAVFRTGLAKKISARILVLAGTSETRLFVLIMLVTSGIGAFVSNTGTVAVMMPIVISLAAGAKAGPSRFLMPLAFASTMGGMLTLIGTTPNMIISQALTDSGHEPLHFFSFLPIGLICVPVGTITLLFLSKWLVKPLQEDQNHASSSLSLRELADKYQLKQNEFRARVRPDSTLVGQTLHGGQMRDQFGVSLLEIRRKKRSGHLLDSAVTQIVPGPETRFEAGDTFSFVGPQDKVEGFAKAYGLDIIAEHDPLSNPDFNYNFNEIGIAELVLLSTSRLVDRKVRDSGLRENYNIRVLGLRRGDTTIVHNVIEQSLKPGDTLLIQGEWSNIDRLDSEPSEWVVVGRPLEAASKETLDHKAPVAGLIVVLMIAVMALNLLAPVTAVMLAALALIFSGCFRSVEEAYRTISWQSVVLVAAMLPASVALEKTGAAALASHGLIETFGSHGPYALLAAVYCVASFVTLFVSNTAAGALSTPIAMQAAISMNLSPYPFLFAVATGASMSLAFPFSTPPNVLVMGPGRYSFMDYVKVGGPMQIIIGIVMVLVLPLLFPFHP